MNTGLWVADQPADETFKRVYSTLSNEQCPTATNRLDQPDHNGFMEEDRGIGEMMKRNYCFSTYLTFIIVMLSLTLFMVGCQDFAAPSKLGAKIIQEIDENCQNAATCTISMKEITDFKWDKLVFFRLGSSRVDVSQALGFEYKGTTDLMSGMIFVLNNEIIHEERSPYYPDHPTKLQYAMTNIQNKPRCVSYTYDEAILVGSKEKIDDHVYYELSY